MVADDKEKEVEHMSDIGGGGSKDVRVRTSFVVNFLALLKVRSLDQRK